MQNLQEILDNLEQYHWWYKARRKIVGSLLATITKNDNKDILSVGCGNGTELSFLEQYGAVTGLDIDSQVVAHCRQKGFEVIQADILSHSIDKKFHIIIAMDIIEHIQDDVAAYHALFGLLEPGGYICFTVPAFPFLWTSFDELTDFPHFRRYTKYTFKKLLKSVENAHIEIVSYYNFFLFPLVVLTKLLDISHEKQLSLPHKIVNTVCEHIFACERFFLKYVSFPWGGSLIAIVRKEEC